MNKYFVIFLLLLQSFIFVPNMALADEITETNRINNINDNYGDNKYSVVNSYRNVLQKDWEKYFTKQSKQLTKIWKKETILKNIKYKTSYARIMFFVSKKGEILSYQIKSSCIPKDDTVFLDSIENTIKKFGKFDILPSNYNKDFIVFTVKFNSYIPPKYQNVKNIEWDRYGVVDIEISQNKSYFILEK